MWNCCTKAIEDITDITTDIDSVTANNNCINNFITDMANGAINFFLENYKVPITLDLQFSDMLSVKVSEGNSPKLSDIFKNYFLLDLS